MISKLGQLSLETERLRIRPIEDRDVKAIYPIHTDPIVNQHLPYDTWLNWDDAKHWYARVLERRKNQEAEQFIIERTSNLELIGTCIAFNYSDQSIENQSVNNNRCIEFGYVLARHAWKQGYMQEAMSAFIPALQKHLSLSTIKASVGNDNTASLALLNKPGFKHVDTTIEEDGVHLCRLRKNFSEKP